ncbi:MAG: hypothetical protein AAF456_20045 [Planctomycetota bacterium]
MDLLTNLVDRFNGWVSGVSRSSRIAIVLVLMLVIVVVLNNNGLNRQPEMQELLPGHSLRRSEIQHICMALDSSGLGAYKVEDNVIHVPASQRSTYLKSITDSECLPSGLQPDRPANTTMNPFITRAQQQHLQLEEKKRVIRELILQLPFVEDAYFEMDTQESASAFEPAMKSALVSVEPVDQACLSGQQIQTLRNHISGALAGFSSEDIVITDLNAGQTYVPGQPITGDAIAAEEHSPTIAVSARSIELENRIRQSLSAFEDLEIIVEVGESQTRPSTVPALTASSGVDSSRNSGRTPSTQGSMPRMQIGTNGAASIAPEAEVMPRRLDGEVDQMVLVSVAVPQSTVESHFNMGPVKTLFGFPLEEESPQILETNFEALKQEIIANVRTLLPPTSFQQEDRYPIQVSLKRNKIRRAAASQTVMVQEALSDHWPTIAILLIGGLMLTFVVRTGTNRRPHRPDQLAIEPPAAENDEDNAAARQLKDEARLQLTQLIQDNPDKAAEVIKSWIRDAA